MFLKANYSQRGQETLRFKGLNYSSGFTPRFFVGGIYLGWCWPLYFA